MKNTIYYFTGTGNSLAAAKSLASKHQDSELQPIPKLIKEGKKITAEPNSNIGIVYPMYAGGLPNIVVKFFELIDLTKAEYVYSLITEGGNWGSPSKQISALAEKSGHKLNSAWWVQLPDNYIPMSNPPEKIKQEKMFEDADSKISAIAENIIGRKNEIETMAITGKIFAGLLYKSFLKHITDFDKKFVVNSDCTNCSICVDVCPVNNIKDVNGKNEWQHHCEGCLACLQFCPKQAISCGGKTSSRIRYHHPSVTVKEMREQKGE